MLRPLRILLPFVAIGAALVLFLGLAFAVFSVGGGTGTGTLAPGLCDAGLSSAPAGAKAGMTVADLSEEQRRNAAAIVATDPRPGRPATRVGSSRSRRPCRSRRCATSTTATATPSGCSSSGRRRAGGRRAR